MSPGDIGILIGAVSGLGVLLLGYFTFLFDSRKSRRQDNTEVITTAIKLALAPLETRTAVIEANMDLLMADLRRKMATIIHSPDPRNVYVDELMDKLKNDEPLTPHEENDVRDILHKMVNWEPGQDVGFTVKDGDQAAAAWLLMTLDYIPIKSEAK